ncbi:MAG TPA: hypothetical protein VMN58_12505, partial [Acidimicrobiales bacterium]|nr:hypothetical protein [Acidimicrobiales bacterium]
MTSTTTPPARPAAKASITERVGRHLRGAALTPELIAFVASDRRRRDPFPAYRRLQRWDPIHRSPLGLWVLSRHADVTAALRHPAMSS